MKKLFAVLLFIVGGMVTSSHASILVFSPNGSYTVKSTLAEANGAADVAGKTVVITSPLSAVQSNISSATVHGWRTDAVLEIRKGGSIGNITTFKGGVNVVLNGGIFNGTGSVIGPLTINGLYQTFIGSGVVTGLDYSTPEMFGATHDGTTDDSSARDRALAATVGTINFPSSKYKFNSGMSINTVTQKVVGNYTTLDFSGMSTSGMAITLTGSGSVSPYYQTPGGIEGVIVKGPGTGGTSVGLYAYAASEPGPSHSSARNCTFSGFNTGFTYGNNSYLITLDNVDLHDNSVGLKTQSGLTNSGEGIKFTKGSIYNNVTGVQLNGSADGTSTVFISNSSIDYNSYAQIDTRGGILNLSNVHMESSGGVYGIYESNSATGTSIISLSNTVMLQGTSSGSTPYFAIAGTHSSHVNLSNCDATMNNSSTYIVNMMASGSVYNEVNSRWHYSGYPYTFSAGTVYSISNNGGYLTNSSVSAGNGLFSTNGNSTTISTVNTWVSLFTGYITGAVHGLYIFRDGTSGGTAIFSADTSGGAHSIYNGITGFNMQWNSGAGSMQIEVTSGTTPRLIYWSVITPSTD